MDISGKGFVPISPHSATNKMTTYGSNLYTIVRGMYLDFLNGTGVAAVKTRLSNACKSGKAAAQLKELLAAEETAAETYMVTLLTTLQALRAQQKVRDRNPITVGAAGIGTTTTKDIFPVDEWNELKDLINASGIFTIPAFEELIIELNPTMIIEDPNEIREFPGAAMFFWSPHRTITEMRTMIGSLQAESHLSKSYFEKIGVSTVNFNVDKFLSAPSPIFRALDFNDERFLFWMTHGYLRQYVDGTTGNDRHYYGAEQSETPAFLVSTASWWTKLQYYWKSDPHIMNCIIQFLYPYDAQNAVGCAEYVATDGSSLNEAGNIAAGEFYIFTASKLYVQFVWATESVGLQIMTMLPAVLCDDESNPLHKTANSGTLDISMGNLTPPDLKRLSYSTAWEQTNYHFIHTFLVALLQRKKVKSRSGGTQKKFLKPEEKTDESE